VLVVHLHGSAPHPVACCEPDGLVKDQRVTSSYPLATTATGYPKSSVRRERCVSPTSATDSRYEHPVDCPIPEHALHHASRHPALRRPAFSQWLSADPQVELRLTATLQLQRGHNPPGKSFGTVAPDVNLNGTPRGPGGTLIVAPPRKVSRRQRFRLCTELVA